MIKANCKPVSESVRLSVEISRCKSQSFTFAEMKVGSDNLIDFPGLQFECLSDGVIGYSGKLSAWLTASFTEII